MCPAFHSLGSYCVLKFLVFELSSSGPFLKVATFYFTMAKVLSTVRHNVHFTKLLLCYSADMKMWTVGHILYFSPPSNFTL